MVTLGESRKRSRKNQAEMGEALGVTRVTISRWENGENPIPSWALLKWCKIAGVSCEEIELPSDRFREKGDRDDSRD